LNEEMEVYKVVDAFTSDTESRTLVSDLIGAQTPHTYFLNYNSHGYA
jgi:hypothetical protein